MQAEMIEVSATDPDSEVIVRFPKDQCVSFPNMQALIGASDTLASLSNCWRADLDHGKAEGIRKEIANAIVDRVREKLAQESPQAAAQFPDVYMGTQWTIIAHETPDGIKAGIEVHVGHLINTIAELLGPLDGGLLPKSSEKRH
jgi:hypothetical protein